MAINLPTPQAYTFNAPSGVPGDITRVDESNVESIMLGTPAAQAFGVALKYDTNGNAIPFAGTESDTSAFQGMLARYAPGVSGNADSGYADTIPLATQVQNIMVRGYMSVLCTVGTPVRGGVVYIRIVASGLKNIGDLEAVSDPGNNLAFSTTQCEWASNGKDSNNNAELRVYR